MSLEKAIETLTETIELSIKTQKECTVAMVKLLKNNKTVDSSSDAGEVDASDEESAADKKKAAAAAKRKATADKKKADKEKEKEAEAEAEEEIDPFADDEEEKEDEITKEDIVKSLQAFAKADKKNPPHAVKLLSKYGAANISQLSKDDYPAVAAALKKAGF